MYKFMVFYCYPFELPQTPNLKQILALKRSFCDEMLDAMNCNPKYSKWMPSKIQTILCHLKYGNNPFLTSDSFFQSFDIHLDFLVSCFAAVVCCDVTALYFITQHTKIIALMTYIDMQTTQ